MTSPVPQPCYSLHPSAEKRRQSIQCMHGTMTRLYDKNGGLRCHICHRRPAFGYLYRCTETTHGVLPISDFVDEDATTDLSQLKIDGQVDSVGASNTAPIATTSLSTPNPHSADIKNNDDDDISGDNAVDEDMARMLDGKRKFETAFPSEPEPELPNCNVKVCQACRPMYRERAWQSLDEIVQNPMQMPPQYELDNRRVSDASTIIKINTSRLPATPQHETAGHRDAALKQLAPHLTTKKNTKKSRRRPSSSKIADGCTKQLTVIKHYDTSDADDEKGFGQDDESDSDSMDTETDLGVPDEAYSDDDDFQYRLNR